MAPQEQLGGAVIVPMTDADLVWVADFQPTDWPDIKTAYKLYTTWWFSHPMKLVLQNQVIGIGNVILFQNSAWLTQIIIRSTHQNQGFGTALTQALIDLVRDKVTGISLLATEMGFPVYKKLGFKIQGEYSFYKWDDFMAEASSLLLSPYHTDYHCAMLDFDRQVTGENRARLLQNYLPEAQIMVEKNKLIAMSIPSLGDGWIISKSSAIGLELMNNHIQKNNRLVLPDDNTVAHDYLSKINKSPYRKAYRMVLGKPPAYRPEWIFGRVGGNLG